MTEPSLSPSDEQVLLRLERLADRLRVVGPRLAAREGEAARELLGRIRAGLQQLADLAADADGAPRRAVPELAAYALGDQAMVLGQDLLGDRGARPGPAPTRSDAGSDERRVAAGRAFAQISALI